LSGGIGAQSTSVMARSCGREREHLHGQRVAFARRAIEVMSNSNSRQVPAVCLTTRYLLAVQPDALAR
jgi:hypothetical protein